MLNPRDNRVTGQQITERQQHHLEAITKAGDGLYTAMHEAEGSNPPDGPFQEHVFMSRRMHIAATHLETCLMFARKAALEGT